MDNTGSHDKQGPTPSSLARCGNGELPDEIGKRGIGLGRRDDDKDVARIKGCLRAGKIGAGRPWDVCLCKAPTQPSQTVAWPVLLE